MTKEEARHYYKKYEQEYSTARANRNKAESRKAACESQKRSEEYSLASGKAEKKNLEERLSDIRVIISLLEGDVPSYIAKANRTAETAGEKYVSAIQCSMITNAGIQMAYRTKSVEEDADSANAYNSCLNEKIRLETAIEELRIYIQKINSKIDSLNAEICSAGKAYDYYGDEMEACKRKASYYWGYL